MKRSGGRKAEGENLLSSLGVGAEKKESWQLVVCYQVEIRLEI